MSTAVLHLLDQTQLGGGETSFVNYLSAARRRSDEFRPVVVLRGDGPLAERLRELDVPIEYVNYPLRLRRGLLPLLALEAVDRIEEIITRHAIQLVHANQFFGLVHGGRAARRRRVPCLWTCHGWWELDNAFKRMLARRLAQRVLCVSEAVRQATAGALGPKVPTATNYLGIEPFAERETLADRRRLRAEVRREMGIDPLQPLIAVVGRFQPIKGHALLLEALPALLARHPRLVVWWIGDALFRDPSDRAERRRLRQRVREAGWTDRVKFLGWRDDSRRLMRALDALVIPSARESFSMVAVEGLEAGVPVVGPDGWGPAEIITVPSTGRRFRPGDVADLAEQILAVLDRGGSGFEETAGPRRVAECFSAAAHVERTWSAYRELLAATARG